MTELTIREPQTQALAVPDGGTELILRAVQQMSAAGELGEALARTTFVPTHFRGKPDDVAAAIMYGAAIGLDPMTALRSIYVVGGNPGLYARQMAAVIVAKGHTVRTVEVTDTSATVSGQRRGSDDVETVTWTIERATRAGYVPTINPETGKYRTNGNGKVIGNEKYLTDPQAMLYARALGDVCRRIAPDALAGLDYTVEELHVIDHVDVPPVERPKRESAGDLLPATPSVAKAKTAPAPAAPRPAAAVVEAPAEPARAVAAPAETDPTPIEGEELATPAQQRAVHAAMRGQGYTDKAEILQVVSDMVKRPIGSARELTKAEASTVLDAIKAEANTTATPEAPAEAAPAEDGDPTFPATA